MTMLLRSPKQVKSILTFANLKVEKHDPKGQDQPALYSFASRAPSVQIQKQY